MRVNLSKVGVVIDYLDETYSDKDPNFTYKIDIEDNGDFVTSVFLWTGGAISPSSVERLIVAANESIPSDDDLRFEIDKMVHRSYKGEANGVVAKNQGEVKFFKKV